MLVLLNQEIVDVGDPLETLIACGVADRREPSVAKLVALGQDAAFAAGGLEHAHPGIKRTLAAYFAMSGTVNCALFLPPPRARSPRDVAVRLGFAPITTMAFLLTAQNSGKLTPSLINGHVWQVTGAAALTS
jgi:hypothetical protein